MSTRAKSRKSRKSRKSTKKSVPRRSAKQKKGGDDMDQLNSELDNLQVGKRQPVINPLDSVIAKYTEFGWTLMRPPRGSINDIVAQKDKKFHFIQIVTPETIDNVKFHGVAKNTFVQNAFSNGAVPVYAHVVTKNQKAGLQITVTFEDVNGNKRIIIGGRKKGPTDKVETESPPEDNVPEKKDD